jgi:hypothetical protein
MRAACSTQAGHAATISRRFPLRPSRWPTHRPDLRCSRRTGLTRILSRQEPLASQKMGARLRHTQLAMTPAETVGRVRREAIDDVSIGRPRPSPPSRTSCRERIPAGPGPPSGEPSTRSNMGNRYRAGHHSHSPVQKGALGSVGTGIPDLPPLRPECANEAGSVPV